MNINFEKLSKSNIFKGLSPDEISALLKDKPFQIKKYVKDEYIAYGGDECRNLMFVLEGSVRGEMSDFSGKKIKIEDIASPRPLAVAFVFGKDNHFPVDIISNENTIILYIRREIMLYVLQNSTTVLKNFLFAISSRTQFLSNKIRFLSFKTIKGKIANYLYNIGAKEGESIIIDQTQTELAEFFGVARPSVARALSEMETEGILNVKGRSYTILDKEKLSLLMRG